MRSPFGRFAVELRARKKLSQSEFAEKVEIALARVSNLEHSRTAISDDVLRRYIKVLDCSGDEAHQLRKLAQYSEALRVEPEPLFDFIEAARFVKFSRESLESLGIFPNPTDN